MSTQKNTITINGKIYDATTGKVIEPSLPFKHIITPTQTTKTTMPKTVDGIVRQSKNSSINKVPILKTIDPLKIASAKKLAHRHTPTESTKLHKKTVRTKTLMRTSVKQPSVEKSDKTTVAFSGLVSQPKHKIIHSSIPKRTTRASSITKSTRISKFSQESTNPSVTRKIETIPVKAAPRNHDSINEKPPIPSYAPPIYSKATTRRHDYFEQAIQNATSHQPSSTGNNHKKFKQKKSRIMQVGTITAIVLVLGGFFAYSNAPTIALKNATSRTGISATIPSYKPTGFNLNRNVQYMPGKVVMEFKSTTDDRAFSITQEKTSLDNQSLASNFTSSASDMVLVQTSSGTPIYIYDETSATWINNGIQYNIKGTAQLSRNQLLNLATSL